MKSFIVFAALIAVALARVPQSRQIPTALYAEPFFGARQTAPPLALYFKPIAPPKGAVPTIPALYIKTVPAASQDASRIASPSPVVLVKKVPSDNADLDSYRFSYEQSDGQKREESAFVDVRSNPEAPTLRIQGSYSYVGDDGKTYIVTYIADENGFQPQGAHLPVASIA